jgi:hypothetical protein
MRGEAGASQFPAPGRQFTSMSRYYGIRRAPAMAVSSREKAGQRTTWPVQSLASETHRRDSAVLGISSSAAGTKRTRSCSPTALPTPQTGGRSLLPSSAGWRIQRTNPWSRHGIVPPFKCWQIDPRVLSRCHSPLTLRSLPALCSLCREGQHAQALVGRRSRYH